MDKGSVICWYFDFQVTKAEGGREEGGIWLINFVERLCF